MGSFRTGRYAVDSKRSDENITDAVLTNCKIKAVFGGLRAESAEMMARELFIGKLGPMKVMAAIYQTKFWPVYGRDKVYAHGTQPYSQHWPRYFFRRQ